MSLERDVHLFQVFYYEDEERQNPYFEVEAYSDYDAWNKLLYQLDVKFQREGMTGHWEEIKMDKIEHFGSMEDILDNISE